MNYHFAKLFTIDRYQVLFTVTYDPDDGYYALTQRVDGSVELKTTVKVKPEKLAMEVLKNYNGLKARAYYRFALDVLKRNKKMNLADEMQKNASCLFISAAKYNSQMRIA